MKQFTKHMQGQFSGQHTMLTAKHAAPDIALDYDAAQRLDNPETFKHVFFKASPHSETANQIADAYKSC